MISNALKFTETRQENNHGRKKAKISLASSETMPKNGRKKGEIYRAYPSNERRGFCIFPQLLAAMIADNEVGAQYMSEDHAMRLVDKIVGKERWLY